MPKFGTPYNVLKAERKLTHEEIIRSIRFNIAAEYEAIQFYHEVIECTDNELVKKVLKDIADEERVHAGELMKLLLTLEPDEAKHYADGAKEVEEMMKDK